MKSSGKAPGSQAVEEHNSQIAQSADYREVAEVRVGRLAKLWILLPAWAASDGEHLLNIGIKQAFA